MTSLRIRSITARPLLVPMKRPLQTSTGAVQAAPLVLIDLTTEEGIAGRSYLFSVAAFALKPLADLVSGLAEIVRGDIVSPLEVESKLRRRTTLLGAQYLLGMAVAGLDMACWDAVARAASMPLAVLLGGTPQKIPAYNSNGLGIMPAPQAAEEALQLVEEGFHAVKMRLGRSQARDDLEAVRAVRAAITDEVVLMTDFNQSLSLQEAIQRGRMLDGEGVYWIEEPVRADDFVGCCRVAAALSTAVQIGENFTGSHQMRQALEAQASDYVMPDVQRIGGVSGWLRASALAHAAGIEMSSHLFPEISASLLAVTPTRHWLEYTDWANPILQQPLELSDGAAVVPSRPGSGLEWDEAAVARFLLA